MSDSPEASWPGNREVDAVVGRAIDQRLDPVRDQLTTVVRALAILADRVPTPEQVDALRSRVDALTARFDEVAPAGSSLASLEGRIQDRLTAGGARAEDLTAAVQRAVQEGVRRVEAAAAAGTTPVLERVQALEAALARDAEARRAQTEDVRQVLAVAVSHAVAKVDQSHRVETDRLVERIDALEGPLQRQAEDRRLQADEVSRAVAATLDRSLGQIEAGRRADTDRLLQQVSALAEDLTGEADGRRARDDDLRAELAGTVTGALREIEVARTADSNRMLEQIAAVEAPLSAGTAAGLAQLDGLLHTVATLEQAVSRIETARSADAAALLERIDALESPLRSEAEDRRAQVDELIRTVGATLERSLRQLEEGPSADRLGGLATTLAASLDQAVRRIEAAGATGNAALAEQLTALAVGAAAEGERRDEQAAAVLATVDERLHALHTAGTRAADEREGRLLSRLGAVDDEHEGRLLSRLEALDDEREGRFLSRLEAILDTLESRLLSRLDAGTDAREAGLLRRLEAVTDEHGQALLGRIDERTAAIDGLEAIPMLVAAEVQSATADSLTNQVEPLVSRLVEAVDALAHEGGRIEAMARGHAGEARAVEERVASLFAEVAERVEVAVDRSRARTSEGQVALGARIDGVAGQVVSTIGAAAGRLEARLAESAEGLRTAGGQQNGALLDAVTRATLQLGEGLGEVRAALFAIGTQSVVEQAAARDAQMTALESLSAEVERVRAAVQEGVQKTQLAAIDLHGLRERLTPHLVALADATTRRADADQAGFDAVLARIDQLLAASLR